MMGFCSPEFSLMLTVSTAQQPLGLTLCGSVPSWLPSGSARPTGARGSGSSLVLPPCPEAEELEFLGVNSGNALCQSPGCVCPSRAVPRPVCFSCPRGNL